MTLWLLALVFFLLESQQLLHPSIYFSSIKWLGYIKVCTTVMKYGPQVYLNWKRGSTKGWSLTNVVFDCLGGVLSVTQLILDSAYSGNWSPMSRQGFNVPKFTLGFVTIFFDLIFVYQFYYYRQKPIPALVSGNKPLIPY